MERTSICCITVNPEFYCLRYNFTGFGCYTITFNKTLQPNYDGTLCYDNGFMVNIGRES